MFSDKLLGWLFASLWSKFQIIGETQSTGGNKPFVVDFSPTGDKIVVGFADSNAINVLSGIHYPRWTTYISWLGLIGRYNS